MDGSPMPTALAVVVLAVGVFVVLLPAIVAFDRTRAALQAAAVTFPALAVVVIAAGVTGSLADVLIYPIAATAWFAGLVCGIAAHFTD